MLHDPAERNRWGRNAQRHVHGNFLVFDQLASWMRLMGQTLSME